MSFATITPTRGDRGKLLGFQAERVFSKVPYSIVCCEEPKSDAIDIVPRIKHGIEVAKRHGYDFVFIVEDDDFLVDDYFKSWGDLSQYDFVGFSDTVYYHLGNQTYQTFIHPSRSSLFCTGFRISALDSFTWPSDSTKFLDIVLWEYAIRSKKRVSLLPNNPNLGIKGHGIGKAAGKGHEMTMANKDKDFQYLKSRVDETSFQFYTNLLKS